MPDEVTAPQAQTRLNEFCRLRTDTRSRTTSEGKSTVAAIAATEPLTPPPSVPYPVTVAETRTVSRQALVAYRGNRYSVPPELAAAQATVTRRLGDEVIAIVTASHITVARHRLAPDGAGALVRDHGHVHALDQTAMAAAAGGRPHRRRNASHPDPTPSLRQQYCAPTPLTVSCHRRHRDRRLSTWPPTSAPPVEGTPWHEHPRRHHHDHPGRESLSAAARSSGDLESSWVRWRLLI
uniref:Transposase for insertion sequence element IS21-like C-terminal domain-containing protein n=1 Tax=Rhodococcus sp. NS1 TaxID=402236 RepID=A0A097SQU7_9NOCA|nr:hypothetical protein LRS1606.458 [Rhodococcus sp. NS1]